MKQGHIFQREFPTAALKINADVEKSYLECYDFLECLAAATYESISILNLQTIILRGPLS